MKKLIAASLLAIGLIAVAQQEASAWTNSRFGIGLNWDIQSGNNSFLWGMWRNGQIPGPEMGGAPAGAQRYGMPQGYQGGQGPPQGYAPQAYVPQAYAPQAYAPQYYAPQPYAPQGYNPTYQAGGFEPVSNEYPNANSLYHFANNPGPVYYYPATWYGR